MLSIKNSVVEIDSVNLSDLAEEVKRMLPEPRSGIEATIEYDFREVEEIRTSRSFLRNGFTSYYLTG